jgi:hypothetical protein
MLRGEAVGTSWGRVAPVLLLFGALGAPASGQLIPRSKPGEPKPAKEIRTIDPPHPYPLPQISWKAQGSDVDPGGFEPASVFDGTYQPNPSSYQDAWFIRTWQCRQMLGTEPWDCFEVLKFDRGGGLARVPHGQFWSEAAGRPVVIFVHGNLGAAHLAVASTLFMRDTLDEYDALPPDALVVSFDWPSFRLRELDLLDLAEKQRRAFVAGYHLARLIQGLPPGTRVSLIGHSEGGRVVCSALHLLGGGRLDTLSPGFSATLPEDRPRCHLRIRAVLIGEAVDHDWIVPGRRLGRALVPVEAMLNLVNPIDNAIDAYPLTLQSGHTPALGTVGLTPHDRKAMPPELLARYAEFCVTPYIGPVHTMSGALVQSPVARAVAPYTYATDYLGPTRVR